MQSDGLVEEIRRRAYDIWEAQGRPDNRQVENWLQAEAECRARVQQMGRGQQTGEPQPSNRKPPPKRKTKPREP